MINVIRDEPVVVAITLDELLLAGQIPIELRYILFSAKVILVMFSLHKLGCSNKPCCCCSNYYDWGFLLYARIQMFNTN